MSAPTVSILVLSVLDTCSDVRARTAVVETNDKPRGVLAEQFFHNVALTEITLNLSQRELLQFWNVILEVGSAPVRGSCMFHHYLVSQPVDGFR